VRKWDSSVCVCICVYCRASFMSKSLTVDAYTIKFQIWDTAGQERVSGLRLDNLENPLLPLENPLLPLENPLLPLENPLLPPLENPLLPLENPLLPYRVGGGNNFYYTITDW